MGDRDKESVRGALRATTEWLEGHSSEATLEEVEAQLAGKVVNERVGVFDSLCRRS